MSHFAEVIDGVVVRVIVAEQDFIGSGAVGDPQRWIQTSYNDRIRKNYAGIGYAFDAERDAFIAPRPFASWFLDEATCEWSAPAPMPTDGKLYRWDELAKTWIESESK